MTKTIRFGAATIAMAAAMGMSTVAHAQDTATATAEAEILEALDIQLTGGLLDFGSLVITGAGTVTLASDGSNRDCSNANVVCVDAFDVPDFQVDGTANRGVTVTLPASATLTNTTDATETMSVDNFSGSEGTSITLDGTGTETFSVGGTINFDGSEAAGIYTGSFDVSVDYS